MKHKVLSVLSSVLSQSKINKLLFMPNVFHITSLYILPYSLLHKVEHLHSTFGRCLFENGSVIQLLFVSGGKGLSVGLVVKFGGLNSASMLLC